MYYLLGFKMICDDEDYTMRTMRNGPGKHISWAKSATKAQKRRKTTHYTKSDIFDVMGEDFHVRVSTIIIYLDTDLHLRVSAAMIYLYTDLHLRVSTTMIYLDTNLHLLVSNEWHQ